MEDFASTSGHGTDDLVQMTTQIVTSYISRNNVPNDQLGTVIQTIHDALRNVGSAPAAAPATTPAKPAVPIRRSIQPDYIVCLEDGKKLKMLKRHLRTTYKLSPEEYRVKWGLPADYPMVAPNYAEQRSAFAKKIGLGRARNGTDKARRG
jgi:predicted transcriptional regulator